MRLYTVKRARLLYGGEIYPVDSTIELDETFAKSLQHYLVPQSSTDDKTRNTDTQANDDEDIDYESYTTAQLKALVEERKLDVKPTGKNGGAIKADYIRALEKVGG